MKRFYCTVCKKIKRVRRFPVMLDNPYATFPEDRVGACNRHTITDVERAQKFARFVKKVGA